MLCKCWSEMLTWYNIRIIVRNVSYIFDEWWSARSAINIRIKLFLNDKSNVVLVLIWNADLLQHSKHCEKSFLYIWRMMIDALSHQHSYNTVLNDTRNVVLVLSCNADLLQHLNQCKKSFLYIWQMMIDALSYQLSHTTVLNDKRNVVPVLRCNVDLAQHLKYCKKSLLYTLYLTNWWSARSAIKFRIILFLTINVMLC